MMSNGDIEKRIEFIIEHQAQFASDIQQLREVQTQFSADIQQLREAVSQTNQVVARLANVTFEGFKDVNAKINALVDSQIRLNEAQYRTDEELRRLVTIVERYFSENRNGR
jgi:uncharacterized protein YoxC